MTLRRGWPPRKYMQSVRPDAPWCPDNIEFIRRINGLGSVEDVSPNRLSTPSYLVLGLGDVYLGAPVATPLDPRHRLSHDQIQPGPDMDPAERCRHRRRVPVHLRHGRSRRLSVVRAHHPGLEHLQKHPPNLNAGNALAAAPVRPNPLLPGQRRRAAGAARAVPARAGPAPN